MDPKPVQMYIYNNIFFSYAIDTNDKYEVGDFVEIPTCNARGFR